MGTPELQRLALRMMRRILPLVETSFFVCNPQILDFAQRQGSNLFKNEDDQEVQDIGLVGLVKYFFNMVGERMFIDGGEKTTNERTRIGLTASRVHTVSYAHNYRSAYRSFNNISSHF